MSLTEEDKLLESLYWSSVEYPLGKFLEDYTLPQIVCIAGGYYGENELTSLGTGQALTLHALSSRKTLVGEDCNGKPLTVSPDCPVKVYVYPVERDQCGGVQDASGKTVDVLSNARYVRAFEGYMNVKAEDECFEEDDILEIMEIDKKNSIIRCRNMATNDQLSFPLKCTTSLLPLIDYKQYTLAEVKEKFDLPVKISFISADDELSQWLSSFGTILLLGETDETVVIATTVGGTAEHKVYHTLQKDLDISVYVADGLLSGDETYEQIATTFYDDVRVQKLFDLDQLAVCRARNAVHKFVRLDLTRQDFLDNEPSKEVLRKHSKMRLKQTLPPLAPKPNKGPRSRDSSLGQPSSPHRSPPDLYDLDNDDLDDDDTAYEEIPDDVFNIKSCIYQNNPVGYQRDPSGFPAYPPGSPALPPRNYPPAREAKVVLDKSKSDDGFEKALGLPFKPPEPRQPRRHQSPSNIYVRPTTYTLPSDLSGLTVDEVGEVLKSLNMGCYVATFKDEMINGQMLVTLDEECLRSLKMNAFHCRKMIKFINGWRP